MVFKMPFAKIPLRFVGLHVLAALPLKEMKRGIVWNNKQSDESGSQTMYKNFKLFLMRHGIVLFCTV